MLKAAIDDNIDHLRPWVPWADDEPSTLEAIQERVAKHAANFFGDSEWLYALHTREHGVLVGGAGLYARVGPGAVEIGYWVHRAWTRRGFALEAAGALTHEALARADIARVEMHIDQRNAASAVIPARLGYRHARTDQQAPRRAGEAIREIMVWEITRGGAATG